MCVYIRGATVYSCQIAYRAHTPENWINVKNKSSISPFIFIVSYSQVTNSFNFPSFSSRFFLCFLALKQTQLIWSKWFDPCIDIWAIQSIYILKDDKLFECWQINWRELRVSQNASFKKWSWSIKISVCPACRTFFFYFCWAPFFFFFVFVFFKFVFFVRSSSALARLYNVNIWIGRPLKAAMLFYSIRRY